MSDDDNLFARWSRRKRRVAEEDFAPEPPAPAPEAEIAEPETPEAEAELLQRLNLPLPETLKAGDDFSVFMKAGVPEFLRKRALRVLWRSNPVLANLDGLNDYDDDFRSPELTKKIIATGYQVGRGFLRDLAEQQPLPADPQAADAKAEAPEDDVAAAPVAESEPDEALPEPVADATNDVEEDGFSFRPRRMTFTT